MNRSKTLVLVSVALAMAFLAVGCDRLWNSQPSNQKTNSAWYWVPGGPAFQDWMMSGSSIIGQATVARPDPSTLNVTFRMFGTRVMSQTRVKAVVNGNPLGGVNTWPSKNHTPSVAMWTEPVAWNSSWDGANKLDVGMYCQFTGGGDCNTWQQTYTWTVDEPVKNVTLPEDIVTFHGSHPGNVPTPNYSYWQFMFTNVPPPMGDIMPNVWYAGWCAEQTHYMNQGQDYLAVLWSSLQHPLPLRLHLYRNGDNLWPYGWDNVNWILNNKQGTFWDVQAAIWYVLGNGGYPSSIAGQAMANGAVANGDGWLPTHTGDLIAVMLEPVCERQLVFIELDP
jgi:hypothetical protein